MEKQVEEKNTEMGNVITRSEEFIQKNQKTILICVVVIVVIVLAVFGLRKWYFQPREVRAAEEMFAAEQWFAQGDYEKALNGDDTYRGFMSIIDSYGCTKAGNLAKYYAGMANLRLGNYDEASKWLGKYSGKDIFTKPLAIMGQGDAEMELGNTDKAISLYVKAAQTDDNYITAPTAWFKAGLANLAAGNKAEALKCFQTVKRSYPESSEWQEIDKYIGLAEATE